MAKRVMLEFDVFFENGNNGTIKSFLSARTDELLKDAVSNNIAEIENRSICSLSGGHLIEYKYRSKKYLQET